MSIIGFYFSKMTAEKKKTPAGKISVNNNVILTSVKEAKINLGKQKQSGIEFKFNYTSKYDPEIASVVLEGVVVFTGKEEQVKLALTGWEKDKKLPPDVLTEVYNYLLEKCTVETLVIGRDMQLPPHVPLPKMNAPIAAPAEKPKAETKKK
jgi:hypothetical protein